MPTSAKNPFRRLLDIAKQESGTRRVTETATGGSFTAPVDALSGSYPIEDDEGAIFTRSTALTDVDYTESPEAWTE